jgi:integrase
MAKQSKRLTARGMTASLPPGMHADGDGLYLVVDKAGNRRWSFIYQWDGKRRELGLGPISKVGLADARELATEQRRHLGLGIDPKEAREAASDARKAVQHTFGSFADALIGDLKSQFRNAKHVAQWEMTLKVYAAPLRSMPLDTIDTADVLKVLKPIWQTKAETASRLRGRIERVLDAAKAQGLRSGENPARWRGHLDSLLPKRQKLTRGHHAAMLYKQVPAFCEALLDEQSLSARALEWTILAACRSGEALGARWDEIDRQAEIWTVPAERMKAGRPHRVPLTSRMLEILDTLKETAGDNPFIFAGSKPKRPLSGMAMTMQMRRMGFGDFTVHGFRSAFRDWAAEETQFPREIAEASLAHIVGDATERAYRRGDALEKRRELMRSWWHFCSGLHAKIVVLKSRGS